MLESNSATLRKVVLCWQKLEVQLQGLAIKYLKLLTDFIKLRGAFHTRVQKQLQPIHYTAMLLDPISLLQTATSLETEATET
jgi:hypothetical protein